MVEINAGTIVIGSNSFLVNNREDENYDNKPIPLMIMGVNGLLLSNTTGLIIIYIHRKYKFADKNLLKRRYNFTQLLVIILR